MKPLDIPPIPTPTELKVMLVLRKKPKGIYARQVLELTGGAIPAKSEHILFQRLEAKGYVSASADDKPIYTLTEPGRWIAAGFARAFAKLQG